MSSSASNSPGCCSLATGQSSSDTTDHLSHQLRPVAPDRRVPEPWLICLVVAVGVPFGPEPMRPLPQRSVGFPNHRPRPRVVTEHLAAGGLLPPRMLQIIGHLPDPLKHRDHRLPCEPDAVVRNLAIRGVMRDHRLPRIGWYLVGEVA